VKRLFFWLLLALLAILVVLVAALYDQGYVLIVYPPWRIELSFVVALAGLILLFSLAYFVIRFVQISLSLPGNVRAWQGRRRQRRDEVQLARLTGALFAGQAAHARKLADGLCDGESSELACLLAARAALDAGDRSGARRCLAGIGDTNGEVVAARQAMQAELGQVALPDASQPAS